MPEPTPSRGRAKAQPGELPQPIEYRWTVLEIAVFHRMKPGTVRDAIKRGELVGEQDGKDYKVPDSEYRKWVRGLSTSRRILFSAGKDAEV